MIDFSGVHTSSKSLEKLQEVTELWVGVLTSCKVLNCAVWDIEIFKSPIFFK